MRSTVITTVFIVTLFSYSYGSDFVIRVPQSGNYPPFFIKNSPQGKQSGLAIELAEILLRDAGIKRFSFSGLPFARGLWYLKNGEIHLMLNLSINEDRLKYINFIGPQLDETVVFVVHRSSKTKLRELWDLKNLNLPVGIERRKYYGKKIANAFKKDEIFKRRFEIATDISSNEKKLIMGRIAGFLGYGYNIFYKFRTNPIYQEFKIAPVIIDKSFVYFGFSKKSVSRQLFAKLKKSYIKNTRNGAFEKVRKRYRYYN